MIRLNDVLRDSDGREWLVGAIIPPESPLGDGEGGEIFYMISHGIATSLVTGRTLENYYTQQK